MARVFLSHSSRDNASAGRIRAWLERQGFEAQFLDFDKHSGIQPGENWEKTLYREIERSHALLILQSANWSVPRWCDIVLYCARFRGKPRPPGLAEGWRAGATCRAAQRAQAPTRQGMA